MTRSSKRPAWPRCSASGTCSSRTSPAGSPAALRPSATTRAVGRVLGGGSPLPGLGPMRRARRRASAWSRPRRQPRPSARPGGALLGVPARVLCPTTARAARRAIAAEGARSSSSPVRTTGRSRGRRGCAGQRPCPGHVLAGVRGRPRVDRRGLRDDAARARGPAARPAAAAPPTSSPSPSAWDPSRRPSSRTCAAAGPRARCCRSNRRRPVRHREPADRPRDDRRDPFDDHERVNCGRRPRSPGPSCATASTPPSPSPTSRPNSSWPTSPAPRRCRPERAAALAGFRAALTGPGAEQRRGAPLVLPDGTVVLLATEAGLATGEEPHDRSSVVAAASPPSWSPPAASTPRWYPAPRRHRMGGPRLDRGVRGRARRHRQRLLSLTRSGRGRQSNRRSALVRRRPDRDRRARTTRTSRSSRSSGQRRQGRGYFAGAPMIPSTPSARAPAPSGSTRSLPSATART